MPAATSIIMGVSAAAGVYGAVESSKASGKADKLNAEALGMSREQYARYLELYAPLEEEAIGIAGGPVEEMPGVAAALSDVDAGAATRGSTLRRMMSGRAPAGGGLEGAGQLSSDIARSGQRGRVMAAGGESKFQRMLQLINTGRGIPQQTGTNITNIAGGQQDLAQAGFAGAGQTFSNLAELYYLTQQTGKPA
jgi:hypothetical protein